MSMICKKCGLETFENSVNCINCGAKIPISSQNREVEQEVIYNRADFLEIDKEQDSVTNLEPSINTLRNNNDTTEIKTHMIKAVIGLIISPSPVSIIAVLYAVSTSNKIKAGDLDAARKSSHTANILANVVLVLAAVSFIAFFIIGIFE